MVGTADSVLIREVSFIRSVYGPHHTTSVRMCACECVCVGGGGDLGVTSPETERLLTLLKLMMRRGWGVSLGFIETCTPDCEAALIGFTHAYAHMHTHTHMCTHML